MKKWIESLFKRMGYVEVKQLKLGRNQPHYHGYEMAKRLDEHRELVECLEKYKFIETHAWIMGWLREQDQYLTSIYQIVYGHPPVSREDIPEKNRFKYEGRFVRSMPEVLIQRDRTRVCEVGND